MRSRRHLPTNLARPDAFPLTTFQSISRLLKYSDKAWNIDTSGGTGQSVETTRIFSDAVIAFRTALNMANGEPGTDTFFNISYGTEADGVSKWPSLQYARHVTETGNIRVLYELAKAHATGHGFTLFVPDVVPYFPAASYNPDRLPNIVEISDQQFLPGGKPNPKYDKDFAAKVFTAWFESSEKWF